MTDPEREPLLAEELYARALVDLPGEKLRQHRAYAAHLLRAGDESSPGEIVLQGITEALRCDPDGDSGR